MNEIIDWFQSNFLHWIAIRPTFYNFLLKTKLNKIQIVAPNSVITNINSTKFLGLTIDSTLSWKEHIVDLTSKLNKACYAIRSIKPFMTLKVLRMVYFSYFHSVMSYGIIFCGNSHLSNNILKYKRE
jgi:hypothetical protein